MSKVPTPKEQCIILGESNADCYDKKSRFHVTQGSLYNQGDDGIALKFVEIICVKFLFGRTGRRGDLVFAEWIT